MFETNKSKNFNCLNEEEKKGQVLMGIKHRLIERFLIFDVFGPKTENLFCLDFFLFKILGQKGLKVHLLMEVR